MINSIYKKLLKSKKVARKESDLSALNTIIDSWSSLLHTLQQMMNQPQCMRKCEHGCFQLIEQCLGPDWKSMGKNKQLLKNAIESRWRMPKLWEKNIKLQTSSASWSIFKMIVVVIITISIAVEFFTKIISLFKNVNISHINNDIPSYVIKDSCWIAGLLESSLS